LGKGGKTESQDDIKRIDPYTKSNRSLEQEKEDSLMTIEKQHPERHEIVEEHEGKTYREHFIVKGDLVIFEIISEDGTPEIVSTHIGRGGPEVAARHLQREMIISGQIRPSEPTETI
jgi:hypothetical protein